jgi:hypothetical protein
MGATNERFEQLRVVSETSAFVVASVFDRARDAEAVLVTPTSIATDDAARRALARLHRAHAEPPSALIARAIELDVGERPFVLFDLVTRCDFDGLMRLAADHGYRASHAGADGFTVATRDALRASARRVDPETGLPYCLGSISYSNFHFGPDGSWSILGFGHNVAVCDANGRVNARVRFFQAPEIAVGGPATASSDFVGLLQLARAVVPFVELDGQIARCIGGNSLREDVELMRRILWVERNVLHASPAARATIDQTIRVSDRIRELIGVWPEPQEFRARVARMLGTHGEEVSPPVVRIASNGLWFDRGSHRVDLQGRKLLGRLLVLLARERAERPGVAVPAAALIEAGWPGERAIPTSASNRLYVSINALRRLGLGSVLVRSGGGYRLSERVPVELEGARTSS